MKIKLGDDIMLNSRVTTYQDIVANKQEYLDRYMTDPIFHKAIERLRYEILTKEMVVELVYKLCVANSK